MPPSGKNWTRKFVTAIPPTLLLLYSNSHFLHQRMKPIRANLIREVPALEYTLKKLSHFSEMVNSTINLSDFSDLDLKLFTPLLEGGVAIAYVSTIILVCILTGLVQRTVFLTFRKLGQRHINDIIVPYLKMINIQFAMYAPLLVLRTLYYPVKDILGSFLCHYINYAELFTMFLSQFQTFFITLFRYICLFDDTSLLKLNNTRPKIIAQITVYSLFIVSFLTSLFIILGSQSTFTLQICLGNYVLLYDRTGYELCNKGNGVIQTMCHLSYATNLILSSNLIESYLLYKCFLKIKDQTESVKSMLHQEAYVHRRRTNGVIIRISVLQWCMEMCNLIFYFIYTIFFLGWNHYVDKFFNLYNVAFAMIILPAFYVSADSNFRTHLAKYGILSAVRYVLKNWNTFYTLLSLKFSKIWRCNIFSSLSRNLPWFGGNRVLEVCPKTFVNLCLSCDAHCLKITKKNLPKKYHW